MRRPHTPSRRQILAVVKDINQRNDPEADFFVTPDVEAAYRKMPHLALVWLRAAFVEDLDRAKAGSLKAAFFQNRVDLITRILEEERTSWPNQS